MNNNNKVRAESKYHEIAVAIAEKIVDGQYPEGSKISSRTTLSGKFNVSPETARKAVIILTDLGIMEAKHGSGVYVSSRKKAVEFVDKYSNVRTIRELRREMWDSIFKQQEELRNFEAIVAELEKMTEKSKLSLAFSPYDLTITDACTKIGQSLGSMNLWQHTGATVVAIKRNEEYIISPGPHAELQEGDTVYFVGDFLTKQRMRNFLFDVF